MKNLDPSKAFLGVGWSFPVAVAADRSVSTADYEDDVRQSICIILGTDRGERLMRPEFGAGLSDFLFEPVTATTGERVRNRVREALIDWEARIDVVSVSVDVGNERNRLEITIEYRVRATHTLHNLVYPFYLDEGASA